LFRVDKDPECRKKRRKNRRYRCKVCKRNLELARSLLEPQYWQNEETRERHMAGRLIPLNKKHPRIPQISEYRPIVAGTAISKFIEGAVIDKLLDYTEKEIH
jgi:hypothetical protein